ncbi:YqeG family HAD IIIA-type phosphatase [Gloeothece verrucosa]|uniref:HAD superfamily (Subfamily IIIA) phosphatase, TIGR01668 n=1 Tax=Gloeothece verrucosa (strain PCC 7822) TaxID=497965 RepID=E0UGY8_GLOV7|nr:YqeG family HAD IIIA-type phosphatase [Gloeothece verrucosa]ADN15587.1 HAD superfamily (subfamily IIIA) phosphatase, TIGR01668 [Gloeothece verrucosa PCC 7822]
MTRAKILQPDLILGDTIIHLSPDILLSHDIKGLILDVDETLVPLRESSVSEDLKDWVEQIRKVAVIWLVSNNISENRIGRIGQTLSVPYLFGAGKPSRRKLRQAIQAMDLPVAQVAMVGDRLFTDVLAGNRLGMFTILVEPMVDSAMAARYYPIRNFEVWFSQKLGISLAPHATKVHKT